MIWLAIGCRGELHEKAAEGLRRLERAEAGKDLFVTHTRDGRHMDGSFHWSGKAWDMLKGDLTKEYIENVVGEDFDVVEHDTHFHVEYDPK